jgi:hypothetical protein
MLCLLYLKSRNDEQVFKIGILYEPLANTTFVLTSKIKNDLSSTDFEKPLFPRYGQDNDH